MNDPDPEKGFVLVPDFKWKDVTDVEHLYYLAIVRRRDLASVRDLTAAHAPLLQHVRNASLLAIEKAHGVAAREVRAFLHYQPSFYHLHVHFVMARHALPGSSLQAGRAHLLDDVLQQLALVPDFYLRATLSQVLPRDHELVALQEGALEEK